MDAIYDALQMEDITAEYDPTELETQKLLTIIAFLFPILFFLPYISYKDSLLAKKISNQILTIFLGSIALSIASLILGLIPILGTLIVWVASLGIFAVMILRVIDAANNRVRTLPFKVDLEIFK